MGSGKVIVHKEKQKVISTMILTHDEHIKFYLYYGNVAHKPPRSIQFVKHTFPRFGGTE